MHLFLIFLVLCFIFIFFFLLIAFFLHLLKVVLNWFSSSIFVLLAFRIFFLRLANFNELPSTIPLMIFKPRISRLWLSVHSSFYIAEIRRSFFTDSITPPNVCSIEFNFIVEAMINCNFESSNVVNIVHDLLKLFSVPAINFASFRISYK